MQSLNLKKILLTFDNKNDFILKIERYLTKDKIEFVEYSKIPSNPTLSHAHYGAEIAREEKVDGIIAIGDKNVVNESMAISIGSCYKECLWDFYEEITKPQ